jgi:hypothetical protein
MIEVNGIVLMISVCGSLYMFKEMPSPVQDLLPLLNPCALVLFLWHIS